MAIVEMESQPRVDFEPVRRTREVLRQRAAATDTASNRYVALEEIWRDLRRRRYQVVDTFRSEHRHFLVLEPRGDEEQSRITQRPDSRKLDTLEAVLRGEAPKAVAADLGTSISTVALFLRQALDAIGFSCYPSRVPVFVAALAASAQGLGSGRPGARECEVAEAGVLYRVISIARPELALQAVLPPAEYTAVHFLVEGKRRDEIAVERGCSARTISNQLNSAFRKLGVSGRSELLALLVQHDRRLLGVPRGTRPRPG